MKKQLGFTLIELLIVIALLGALAVGLIGALDPFEQLKKGTDTGLRDLVSQTQTAILRYYSVKNEFPWCDPTQAGHPCADATFAGAGKTLDVAPMADSVTRMVAIGELKSNFTKVQANSLAKILTYGDSTTNFAIVCYMPASRSFKADPNTNYTDTIGTKDTALVGVAKCIGSGGEKDDCYWCIE